MVRSAKNEYNKEGNENYPCGGLLVTEVVPNISPSSFNIAYHTLRVVWVLA